MKRIALVFPMVVALLLTPSCKKENTTPNNDITAQINAYPNEPLSAEETESLTLMREEEKLAQEVYLTLYNKWGVNIFSNIASSEATHTSSVLTLLQKYNLPDPVGNNGFGEYTDSTLQNLYNQLVALGSSTVLDAYTVGATIEDLDIYDLNEWIAKVDNQDILFVFANLNKGSRNHMRSFYSQILSSGGSYSAQFISQSELDAIINSSKESGGWN